MCLPIERLPTASHTAGNSAACINAHGGVLFILWDEPFNSKSSDNIPFIVVGPNVKPGFTSTFSYSHSSYVKSVEQILGLPVNPRVSSASAFGDFFTAGHFP
jgi:hypothetical protein